MIWWKRKDGRGYTAQDRLVVTALVLSSLIVPSNLKAAPAETLPSADSAPINSVSVNPLFLPAKKTTHSCSAAGLCRPAAAIWPVDPGMESYPDKLLDYAGRRSEASD